MTTFDALDVKTRDMIGTGSARAVRQQGFVPVSLYGDAKAPINLKIEARILVKEMHKPGFSTKIFSITFSDKKERALVRDVQLHPVTDAPMHVDLMRVSANSKIHLKVPLYFTNNDKCPGLKMGGILNVVHHTIDVNCSPDTIPKHFEIDLDNQDIGFTLRMPDIPLPTGVSFAHMDENETLATIVPPKVSNKSNNDDESVNDIGESGAENTPANKDKAE